ncbi:MAG: response regulator [Gammaproteobacteria bacterium]|nr:response regulator [Gammaproteobacteria bacterium]
MLEFKKFTVLIVDDNKHNLFTLRTLLNEHIDMQILEAESGQRALDILLEKNVDLILLDVQMPEMDGFETAGLIHSWKKTRHIPIVFITAAYKSEEFRKKGFAIGAADYLTKPIDAEQLISRVKAYLRFIAQERKHNQELSQANRQLQTEINERKKTGIALMQAKESAEQANRQLQAEINERKKTGIALRQAKEAAEQASLAKSQFLANMSHELRTPLNAVIGYSEMLIEEAEEEAMEQDKSVEEISNIVDLRKINSAGVHLLALVNDVLDVSKIEAGKMELYNESFDVAKMVHEVMHTVRPMAEKNGNTLKNTWKNDLGNIFADLTKLRQILLNLLSNACKFTKQGIIELAVNTEIRQGVTWFYFRISDSGIGMTPAQQVKLFQAFTQVDASTTRKYGGTGLGLKITKHFTEMMGGSVNITSEAGHGSTFTIHIPAKLPDDKAPAKAIAAPTGQKTAHPPQLVAGESTILVIDHDPEVAELLKNHLNKLEYKTVIATDGREGIKLAKELRPSAITLAVMMPEMNGWSVLSALKNDAELADIPVIMLSAVEDKNKGYSLGASEYLVKPVNRELLAMILDKYRSGTTASVLVVEDDQVSRKIMKVMLNNAGWEVELAENGRVALELIAMKRPNLIVLDLMMPEMDGAEFAHKLRQEPAYASIPVVVLTSQDLSEKEQETLRKDVTCILQKDACNRQELLAEMSRWLSGVTSPAKPETIINNEIRKICEK